MGACVGHLVSEKSICLFIVVLDNQFPWATAGSDSQTTSLLILTSFRMQRASTFTFFMTNNSIIGISFLCGEFLWSGMVNSMLSSCVYSKTLLSYVIGTYLLIMLQVHFFLLSRQPKTWKSASHSAHTNFLVGLLTSMCRNKSWTCWMT